MKRLCPILLLLTVIVHFSSCEKDDICVEGDTPLLIIGFYDIADTTFKSVSNFRIRALDNNTVLNNSADYLFSDRGSVSDSILIPLRIAEPSTAFEFISGSEDDDEGNEIGNIDNLTFTYTVDEAFVSRACGFVANFNGLDTIREVAADDWIQSINIVDTTITNSNEIHVQIFH